MTSPGRVNSSGVEPVTTGSIPCFRPPNGSARRGGKEAVTAPGRERAVDDIVAALVGVAAGLLVAPLADRLATNAPLRRPLLQRAPRSRRLVLVAAGTAGLGAACGLAFGLTLDALAA